MGESLNAKEMGVLRLVTKRKRMEKPRRNDMHGMTYPNDIPNDIPKMIYPR